MWPYEASIFYDVANGYDIVYEADYESPFDLAPYEHKYMAESEHYNEAAAP